MSKPLVNIQIKLGCRADEHGSYCFTLRDELYAQFPEVRWGKVLNELEDGRYCVAAGTDIKEDDLTSYYLRLKKLPIKCMKVSMLIDQEGGRIMNNNRVEGKLHLRCKFDEHGSHCFDLAKELKIHFRGIEGVEVVKVLYMWLLLCCS